LSRVGARRQSGGVAAGAGLGQAVAGDPLHRNQARQVLGALGVVAEAVDHPGDHVVDRQEGRGGRAARRQRLEHHRGVEAREAGAAALLPDIERGHPERRGFPQFRDREMLRLVPGLGVRRQPLLRECERGLAQFARGVRKLEGRGLVERHGRFLGFSRL
jgi:hypothetical protein